MIHHITAICSEAHATLNFYTKILGLRLVKLTVNQDDVGTYHFYFGNKFGEPGTVITFFLWRDLPKGIVGNGMVSKISFAIPQLSMEFWEKHLIKNDVKVKKELIFGNKVLCFCDPDGLELELVENGKAGNWGKAVPEKFSINGFYGATIMIEDYKPTSQLLIKHFGYKFVKKEGELFRFSSGNSVMDINQTSIVIKGEIGIGSVHHIAFRTKNKETQLLLRKKLKKEGFYLTPSIDRYYFRSVYFREPGGVLFEIATDGPGFTIDEREEELGSKLVLPPIFEKQREKIEKLLPKIELI